MTTRVDSEQGAIPNAIKRAREEIEKKTGKTPEQLYEEREKRARDATELKEPDRVPFGFNPSNFVLTYFGKPQSAQYYERGALSLAAIKTLLDFEPDLCRFTFDDAKSGLALEALGPNYERWPGGNLPPDVSNQAIGAEIMKAEEYDLFLTDPTDFMLRYFMPRSYEALEPFSRIPSLMVTSGLTMATIFARPSFQEAAQTLLKAGLEQEKWQGKGDITANLGIPPYHYPGGVGLIPFDWIGQNLRGMNGLMRDIHERPEKLIAACEKLLERLLARALPADPTKRGHPRRVAGGVTFFCTNTFISSKQFETFVWPTWKKSILANIDLGFVPWIKLSGKADARWDHFLELPRGKFIIMFEEGAMAARAKAMFGNHCCIMGFLPWGLLDLGSPQEVEEECRKALKVCMKGGGYIFCHPNALSTGAKPANVKAMADTVKKYGRY